MENINNDIPKPPIDMAPLNSTDCEEKEFLKIGKEIVDYFKDPGFVYLKNVGISTKEIEDILKATNKFFELDNKELMKLYRDVNTLHGFSTDLTELVNFNTSLAERTTRYMFDIQGLDSPFPDEVPELKTAAIPLTEKLVPITQNIFKALEVGLDFPSGFLVDKHKHMFGSGSYSDLKIIRYSPPLTNEQTIRFEAHYDFSTITMQLHQDLEGLQLLDTKGNWQTAKVFAGQLLLFPSEQLQMMTGERIKAVKHQVLNPTEKNDVGKERHAVIFFPLADNDADIRPYNHSDDYPIITGKEYSLQKAKLYLK